MLVAAAFLHDVGYAPALAATGFHPLDGAEFIAGAGHERLASLVAHHAGARHEASLLGLSGMLERYPRRQSVIAAVLDFCDLSTGPRGERWALTDRLQDIVCRHPDDSAVVTAVRLGRAELARNYEVGRVLLEQENRLVAAT
jgi:hypothetical protein